MTVLDLGGTEESWDLAPARPARLLIVNHPDAVADHKRNTYLGDACDPNLLAGEQFDLVYSNSVIEHVGGHYRRQQFADTVERLGEHHWIQTPYRYFPVEPHYLFPGLQFFPVSARAQVTRWWPMGNLTNVKTAERDRGVGSGDRVVVADLDGSLLPRLRDHLREARRADEVADRRCLRLAAPAAGGAAAWRR